MKHCITVNYARERNAEIALSTSKGGTLPTLLTPLGQLGYRFALQRFGTSCASGTMTTG